MENIELVVSESLKRGKWIDIVYRNNRNEITYYWIAIKDIDLINKLMRVNIFNSNKSLNSLDAIIKFENILSARILAFTNYDTPLELIKKIENNPSLAKWLKYETFNNNILRYYMKCNELDNDPYQNSTLLISGIDKDILLRRKQIVLNEIQEKEILNYIKKYDVRNEGSINYMVLSFLSIDDNGKTYVILYYDVMFNPASKRLSISSIPRINSSFLINNKKHSINSYIDIDPSEFVNNITRNLKLYFKDYLELIRSNLRDSEMINEMPEFMILKRDISANLFPTYSLIEEKSLNGNMEYPLKAFFGNSNRFGAKRKEPAIVIYDNKVNIDQMQVIYNTMKYPVNYVEGPPGTGKTQTIINVILSEFFNSKTTLVCSSNNKPINGILEKLKFSYKEKDDVLFPYIRLGNREEVLKATLKILKFYNFEPKYEIDDASIEKLKNKTNNNNKQLLNYLEIYENRKELSLRINSALKLLDSITNHNSHLYLNTFEELQKLKIEYEKLPIISNDDVLKQVNSVSLDDEFKKYIYFESLKYVRKLRTPKYKQLIEICKIEDSEVRITNFNNWCSDDDNIKLLENVFPIIFTTNISASRLGTANHTFDLVIMDEAGQCNVATALLPIARAKKLLLVGDTNQLKPVIVLEELINERLKEEYKISDDYDYTKNSILDVMLNHDSISKNIMLTYHYRCGRKIIDFSNKRFYDSKLNLDYLSAEGSLTFINVKNINSKLRNENYEEAKAIVDYVKRNDLDNVAIITPFKNQQNLINTMLKENNINDIFCGTIHQMQGDEKNTIIISTSISPKTSQKTFEWLKNNSEITNVAVTRAKNNLIVVSDNEALNKLSLDKNDDLYNLVNYVKNNGNIEVLPNNNATIQIGKSNGSKIEDYFFKTISHFCSTNDIFQAKRNVKISELFYNDPILSKSLLEFDIVLYEIVGINLVPKIAFELQGGEHFGNFEREKCDARKNLICKEKNIKLIEIPNSYAKSYDSIKKLILLSCGEKLEQLELF